jgi:hypothetical protein
MKKIKSFKQFKNNNVSEEPTNVVGDGKIAGIGVGDQGEPGVSDPKKKKYRNDNIKAAKNLKKSVLMARKVMGLM